MIDFNADNTTTNAQILLEGMFYSELPPIFDYTVLKENILEVLMKMEEEEYIHFRYESGFIKDYKEIIPPKYIRGSGVETITYYAFKRNTTLREMQIPHLLHYCGFIYNSLFVFEDIFTPLYLDPDHYNYVENSNSYFVVGNSFTVSSGYNDWEELEEGIFTNDNNKIQNNAMFGENRRRYSLRQEAYLYSLKMDIESFFPNIYTHYFEKIAEYEPYKRLKFEKEYFVYLDNFHQKINNNQTKGIPAGVFSSHIAAELCMLCVDYLIRQEIGEREIGYIRYVDDMTFFCDSKQELEQMAILVQRILNKFRLRVNGSKTEYNANARFLGNRSNIRAVYERLPFLKEDQQAILNEDEFQCFKVYMSELLKMESLSQMKAILTLFLRRLKEKKLELGDEEYTWFCYIYILAFENENLVYHVYKILDEILEGIWETSSFLAVLNKKTGYINERYKDTLFQIWHYYVLVRHMSEEQRAECMEEYFRTGEANPIIVCWFAENGDHKNKKLIKHIKEIFSEDTGGQGWQQQIMFSKWWLPLLKIRMMDKHNYYKIMQGGNFPQILEDLTQRK